MATLAQVRNKALKKLRVLEEGETPTNEVAADADDVYNELHAYLASERVVIWDADEEVPAKAVRAMVTILAAELADDFGVDEMRYQRLQVEAYGVGGKEKGSGGAKATLLALAKHDRVPQPTPAEYY